MEVEAVFSKAKNYPPTNFRSTNVINDKDKPHFIDVVSIDPLMSKNISEITYENDNLNFQEGSKKMLRITSSSLGLNNDRVGCKDDMGNNEETAKICNTKKGLSFSITNILQTCKQRSNKSHGSSNTRFAFCDRCFLH